MKRQLKSPEIREAKAAILKFLQDHNLNPMKDYSKHPKYGREFSMLLMKLTKERQKIEKIYPQLDIKNQTKHLKAIMAKKEKKAAIKSAEKELKKASLTKKESKAKVKEAKGKSSKEVKEKKERKPRVFKYDYPLVNGKEMSPDQKKKYRIEQRKLANGENPEKKSKVSKKSKEAPVKETKKVKKASKSKEVKVEKKSKKKVKKEED
jgi:protein PXR1